MTNKISASLMCVDPFKLKETIKTLEKHNVDYIHIDIMDGKFVPNIGIGSDFIKALRKHSSIPFDFHIMVKDPDMILGLLDIRNNDLVSIHYESSFQIQRTLENYRKFTKNIMIAINPATPLCVLEELIYFINGINLLMVNPGFAGQKTVQNCIKKAEKVGRMIKKFKREDIIFEVDGNITNDNANMLKKHGANIFVAGTSSIFGEEELNIALIKLKNAIGRID